MMFLYVFGLFQSIFLLKQAYTYFETYSRLSISSNWIPDPGFSKHDPGIQLDNGLYMFKTYIRSR